MPGAELEVEVRPAWPHRLPSRGSPDGTTRARGGVLTRLLYVEETPVIVQVWRRRDGTCVLRAVSDAEEPPPEALKVAIGRMRFALGIDDDLGEFYDAFRGDRLLARAIRRRPWIRPRRSTSPWEALAWAVTRQLIESPRAAAIQRRIVRRWGPELRELRDVPSAAAIAGVAPAELASMDLAPSRAVAIVRIAREVATGRADLRDPDADRRLVAIPGIGTWTVRCLSLFGRGDPDALPSGDLGYIKLIGRLAGLGRRATIEEVEEFFEPYAPFRGLAGTFILATYHGLVAAGPPLRKAA
ncbi:MAG: DNA-3-methyladenine glycosylase family protein [Solirubrobacterales bacterium]